MGGDRRGIGILCSPMGAKIKVTLQAPLLESMHKAVVASI